MGNNVVASGQPITNFDEITPFINCLKIIALKKDKNHYEEVFDYKSENSLKALKNYNAQSVGF